MVNRQLERVARAFSAIFFSAISAAILNGCSGVPGNGPGFETQVRPSTGDNAELARAANKYVSASTRGSAGYLVGPQDVLDITVFKAPDLSKTVQVAEDGSINLPLIGHTPAAAKTPSQLERDIQARLDARYMKSSQVTVFVKEFNSQRVTLEGAVKSPGVFPLRGNDTLMQVIAKGGGLDRVTASDDVVIFRTIDGTRTAIRIDVSAIQSGTQTDPQVLPGDVVVVNDSMAKEGLNIFLRMVPVAGLATPLLY